MHGHSGAAPIPDVVLAIPVVLALFLYVGGVAGEFRRGRRWPWYRSTAWLSGVVAAASGFLGPLAAAAHDSFGSHMLVHLVVGMGAPLLLVLAAPVTLALRTLDVVPARRLSRLLNSRPARLLTHPGIAALLSVGGMWVLYLSPLYELMQRNLLVHLAVMTHFLLAGLLFTVSIVPVDPAPHQASYPVRAVVLVLALAAHGVLAKTLYASPPAGVTAADAEAGAMLMYYGGDAIDAAIIVILCHQWYRHAGRRLARAPRVVAAAPGAVVVPREGPGDDLR